jgi:hypothetical protein
VRHQAFKSSISIYRSLAIQGTCGEDMEHDIHGSDGSGITNEDDNATGIMLWCRSQHGSQASAWVSASA